MSKLKVGILYGGRSVEHAVSVNSARNIYEYIDKSKFEPIPVGITENGKWFKTETVNKQITQGSPVSLSLDPDNPKLLFNNESVKVDVMFPLLHGTDGEDGSVQGLLQSMTIPCVGSGVLGSALSMNKIIAKQLLMQAALPIGRFLWHTKHSQNSIDFHTIVQHLGLPLMVKSASLGSSVGVSKVNSEEDFQKAVADSFQYDNEILFEEYIEGREIECAVLGNNPPVASNPGEIVISKKYEFYTFDAKYVDPEAVRIDVPAQLEPSVIANIQSVSVKAFEILRCLDYARVDLFLSNKGKVFLNEINTIPGFTNSSMFPMMWKERGISFTDLISKLINIAIDRHNLTSNVSRGFESDLKY
jgi:D-alanine-D-alanine ligase